MLGWLAVCYECMNCGPTPRPHWQPGLAPAPIFLQGRSTQAHNLRRQVSDLSAARRFALEEAAAQRLPAAVARERGSAKNTGKGKRAAAGPGSRRRRA